MEDEEVVAFFAGVVVSLILMALALLILPHECGDAQPTRADQGDVRV